MNITAIHRIMTAAAGTLLVLLLLRAVLTVDPYWDVFSYHLPFAARLSGICSESCFQLGDFLQAAYDGYPKLFHRLQGIVWKLTGLAQTEDLLNVAGLALFCVFLRQWFCVPATWAFCGLLAVPLIQIQATSTLVDLPVNLAVAAAILSLLTFVRAPEAFGWRRLAVLLTCLAFAANSKPQMVGVVAALGAMFGATAVVLLARGRQVGPFAPGRRASWIGLTCLLVAAGTVTAAKSIDNAIDRANPFYPVRVEVAGVLLDGPSDPRPGSDSMSEAWRAVPTPLRWLASVLELGAYDYREVPWTYDQGYCQMALAWKDCWRDRTPSFHMGGYFVPYVLGLLAFFVWRLAAQGKQDRRLLVAALAGATLLASAMPRSHELRYYLFWIVVLVALCLITVCNNGLAESRRRCRRASALLCSIILVALLSVVSMTKARYVSPIGPDMEALIDTLGIERQVAAIPDGAVVCVDPAWQPFTFLFAPVFHPGRSYTVLDGQIGDCSTTVPAPSDDQKPQETPDQL